MEPGPGGGGEQRHLGVEKDPVTAERAAELAGGHDGHALGVQAAAMDLGAVHAHQGVDPGAQQPSQRLGLPADQLRACSEGRNRSRQPTSAAAARPPSPARGRPAWLASTWPVRPAAATSGARQVRLRVQATSSSLRRRR